jgi:hypothetical protein
MVAASAALAPKAREDRQVDIDELAANWKHRLTPGAIRL